MVAENKSSDYLTFVPFANFNNWSVQYLLETKNSYNEKYDFVKIGSFLRRNKTSINIENNVTYKRVTVKINNNGVYLRDTEKGINIGTKKQFLAQKGNYIISKIDARNGAFGIIPEELNNAIVTNDFPLFYVDEAKININFLLLITTTKEFIKFAQSCSSGTTNRQRMDVDLFLEQKIPLPTLEEQNRIVTNYNTKLQLAQQQEKQAKTLETEIEKYLFEELGVEIFKKKSVKKGLNMINFSDLSEWGADKALKGNNDILFSKKYPSKKLSLVALVNPRTDISKLKDNNEMSFIPMECVSDDYGEIKELRNGIKKASSGYTKFQENDLIWARITPCMQNGKSTIVKGLTNNFGYGSTEFHIVRKLNDNFNLEFAYHLLRSKTVRKDATSYFTGSAGQQRVPKSYLENLLVPIPPVEIQIQISNHINSIKEQIKELNALSAKNKEEAIVEFEKEIFN